MIKGMRIDFEKFFSLVLIKSIFLLNLFIFFTVKIYGTMCEIVDYNSQTYSFLEILFEWQHIIKDTNEKYKK